MENGFDSTPEGQPEYGTVADTWGGKRRTLHSCVKKPTIFFCVVKHLQCNPSVLGKVVYRGKYGLGLFPWVCLCFVKPMAGLPLTGPCCRAHPGQTVPWPHHPLSAFGSRAPPWASQQCFGTMLWEKVQKQENTTSNLTRLARGGDAGSALLHMQFCLCTHAHFLAFKELGSPKVMPNWTWIQQCA